jgi:hypothetical protein
MVKYTSEELEQRGKLYARGKMSLHDQIAFEQYLEAHPIQKMMVEGMIIDYHYFNEEPLGIHKCSTPVQRKLGYPMAVAAAVTLLLVAGVVYYGFTRYTSGSPQYYGDKVLTKGAQHLSLKNLKVKNEPLDNQRSNTGTGQQPPQPPQKRLSKAAPHHSRQHKGVSYEQLLALNKQEIAYWEGELDLVTDATRSASGAVKVLSIDHHLHNKTTFRIAYTGSTKLYMTIYSASNMIKPLLSDAPLTKTQGAGQTFSKTINLPKGNTYYWQLTNEEEEVFIGKLIK